MTNDEIEASKREHAFQREANYMVVVRNTPTRMLLCRHEAYTYIFNFAEWFEDHPYGD
jgi:hypothetical protein